ncbi:uncharacterized protein THITE_2056590 [Thermothielavioides terrestris NRRL 8126]|uniref:D-serine dehydratase-like domain-containing protein n=1 Tax=Thermothielavioides terrestris (strain ATCC 38088 / NRRL 8126) TaxID=578455 RepID=G2RFN4_THETT|nr:uncharacterized protein THITE_2056590 [Thermothielavioides terrestris NRRL 8126]AEO70517.1 hypothetical protein THITE_2056590 [Thermothielavioides terrestris NRRL 8126]
MARTAAADALKEQLRGQFVGKTLHEVPTPSVVLDLAKLEVNCERMLEATERLGLLWRAHIKSHKILFSFPLLPTAIPRLAALTADLGPDTLTLMIDHPSQLTALTTFTTTATTTIPHRPLIFLKIDTSYGRAGVPPSTPACTALLDAALAAEQAGACALLGLYSHAGHSYAARGGVADVVGYLAAEVRGLVEVAREVVRRRGRGREREKDGNGDGDGDGNAGRRLVLSVGATPTATVVQQRGADSRAIAEVQRLVEEVRREGFALEVHAGVYPTLDLQQLATHARDESLMTADDIAISVVAEVASIYPGRGANGTTEALINAGTLALGREPVMDKGEVPGHDYSGWGLLMPWGLDNPVPGPDFPRVHDGWQVGRISQEHGILTWQGRKEDEVALRYGQRVRVWPNHSCIAGACFDWYLIVDSRNQGREDEVIDVWPRWRGW